MVRGELIADSYELLKRLGRGGMGEVSAARGRTLHRDCVVMGLFSGGGSGAAGGESAVAGTREHRLALGTDAVWQLPFRHRFGCRPGPGRRHYPLPQASVASTLVVKSVIADRRCPKAGHTPLSTGVVHPGQLRPAG